MSAPTATLGELAGLLGAELRGDPGARVARVADLSEAGPDALAPFTDSSRHEEASACRAAALLVRRFHPELPLAQLICADPRWALGKLLDRFALSPASPDGGVDPRAIVEAGALVDPSAWIGPLCYIGVGARIGARAQVFPFCYVGAGVQLGSGCWVGPGATLLPGSRVDDDVRIGAGAVVGSDGFGFYRDHDGQWHRLPSRGGARLSAGVELGAGSCVDSGTLGPTLVGEGSKVDNLVQIGHNAVVGARVLLCAQVGLAGSSQIDDDCLLGGQAGVADHRHVGCGTRVAAQAGIVTDVAPGATVGGTPAMDEKRWLRASVLFSRLAELQREVKSLRRELNELRCERTQRREETKRLDP